MTDAKAKFEIRPFAKLGAANHGWLDAHHHFSFGNYHDAARMNWGAIRVWNDDVIAPQSGFPPHPHADMEIITYVRTGAITHKDSLGNEGRTAAGDVQVMSAGSGIRHAEYNLENEPTTLFQIWIIPNRTGGEPSWGAKPFPKSDRTGAWQILASGFDEDDDALSIRHAHRHERRAELADLRREAEPVAQRVQGHRSTLQLTMSAGLAPRQPAARPQGEDEAGEQDQEEQDGRDDRKFHERQGACPAAFAKPKPPVPTNKKPAGGRVCGRARRRLSATCSRSRRAWSRPSWRAGS
mgnify:CR=1 FL=1